MTNITKKQYDENVAAGKKMVVAFKATWCGPCKQLTPTLVKLAAENTSIEFYAVDVDNEPDLTMNVGIRSVPTIIYISNGDEVGRTTGNLPASAIYKYLDQL